MIVYALTNKNNPTIPFYIGITNNPARRLQQHKTDYQRHKPYIQNKNEITLHPLINTGENQYSQTLAEKIETNLIRHYHTVTHGSNKVYDVKEYFKNNIKPRIHHTPHQKKQNKTTKEFKAHQRFKRVIKVIHDDPCWYTPKQITNRAQFNYKDLDKYCKKYHNTTFKTWLQEYREMWLNYIVRNAEKLKNNQ